MSKANLIYSGLCGALLLGLMWAIASDASGLCNDTSRLATADALVNHGTFSIDKSIFFYTCDRIKVDGIFFSDKPPFLSLFYALLLFLLQAILQHYRLCFKRVCTCGGLIFFNWLFVIVVIVTGIFVTCDCVTWKIYKRT